MHHVVTRCELVDRQFFGECSMFPQPRIGTLSIKLFSYQYWWKQMDISQWNAVSQVERSAYFHSAIWYEILRINRGAVNEKVIYRGAPSRKSLKTPLALATLTVVWQIWLVLIPHGSGSGSRVAAWQLEGSQFPVFKLFRLWAPL